MDLSHHPDIPVTDEPAEATPHETFGGEPLTLRLLNPTRIDAAAMRRWDELGQRKSGGNVFAEPWLTRISLEHCDPRGQAVLAVVEDRGGAWLGAVPLVRAARHGRLPWPNWTVWRHPNQFNGTPLVRAGHETRFWRALLAGLDRHRGLALGLCLTELPSDDPVNQALVAVCREEGRELHQYRRYARASLRGDAQLAERAEQWFKPKSRRRLCSLERQLAAELGPVTFHTTRDPARIVAVLDTFLALEASGWKGAAGSALDRAADTRAFFHAAARAAAARGRFEVSWLDAGGQCLAMTTQFVGPGWSSGFKRAHDERYARYAPGLVHLMHLTRHLCARGQGHFDSSAAPGEESVNRLWPDRRELFDCRVAIGGRGQRLGFKALSALQGAWHAAKRMW